MGPETPQMGSTACSRKAGSPATEAELKPSIAEIAAGYG